MFKNHTNDLKVHSVACTYPVRTALAVLDAVTLDVSLAASSPPESLEPLDDNDARRYLFMTAFTGDLQQQQKSGHSIVSLIMIFWVFLIGDNKEIIPLMEHMLSIKKSFYMTV